MIYIVDIDGTICDTPKDAAGKHDYVNSQPFTERIAYLNHLFDCGHEMDYWTARGTSSGLDWYNLTREQLQRWGVKYSSLRLGKPSYDVWIDDKAMHAFEIPTVIPNEQTQSPGSA